MPPYQLMALHSSILPGEYDQIVHDALEDEFLIQRCIDDTNEIYALAETFPYEHDSAMVQE